jgi:hypothetical protein
MKGTIASTFAYLSGNYRIDWTRCVGLYRTVTIDTRNNEYYQWRKPVLWRTTWNDNYTLDEILKNLSNCTEESWYWLAHINYYNLTPSDKERIRPILLSVVLTETGEDANLARNIAKYYLKEWFDE